VVIELSDGFSNKNITFYLSFGKQTQELLMAALAKVPLIGLPLRHSILGFLKTPFVPPKRKPHC
jgi:hypothetical protein